MLVPISWLKDYVDIPADMPIEELAERLTRWFLDIEKDNNHFMVCTGGGTCAAACPYHALTLQNNTTDQREARAAALAKDVADLAVADRRLVALDLGDAHLQTI